MSAPEVKREYTPAGTRGKRLSAVFLVLMVLGCIGLDQVSKVHAQDRLMKWSDDKDHALYQGQRYPVYQIGQPPPPEGGTDLYLSFNLNYVRNPGAAWGALSGVGAAIRVPFFYLVTVLAVILIGVYIRSTPPEHRLAIYSLALVLSGAIGNFIDRLRLSYVIDFIDVRWNILGWRYDFPNFNIADSAITVGVSLLLFDMMVLERYRRRPTGPARDVAPAV